MPRKKTKPVPLEVITDPVEAAKAADLHYISDDELTIRRRRAGKGFAYVDAREKPVRDSKTLDRIKALGIPPAWIDVRITPDPNGHIQAVGRDARGRKQYRYHARWRAQRSETKFNRMIAFGEALPRIRERVEQDLALPGLPKQKVLALVVRLLETTLIRIGNEEYANLNKSFGLTTLRDQHVAVSPTKVQFHFRGKSGKMQAVSVNDRRLARLVRRCKDIPGYDLFQYVDDDGNRQSISSSDVNAYLREIAGEDFTAKDFRTWGGTVLSVLAFQEIGPQRDEHEIKKNVTQTIKKVAEQLGNTPAICSKYYVHPAVVEAYSNGSLIETLQQQTGKTLPVTPNGLRPEEKCVMKILQAQVQAKQAA
jgi:DNA topoisomerase I